MRSRNRNIVIIAIRSLAGLTQRELAARAGLDPVYICQLETGTRKIGPTAANKIRKAFADEMELLGFDFDALLDGAPQVGGAAVDFRP